MHGHKQATEGSGPDTTRGDGERNELPASQRPPLSRLLHDLNQPLSAINNYAQAGIHLIDNKMIDPTQLKDLFSKIAAQATRAATLSQDMRKAVAHEEQQS